MHGSHSSEAAIILQRYSSIRRAIGEDAENASVVETIRQILCLSIRVRIPGPCKPGWALIFRQSPSMHRHVWLQRNYRDAIILTGS